MKKYICLIISVLFILPAFSVSAHDGMKEYTTLVYNDRKSEIENYEEKFLWDDGWFDEDPEKYNHTLASSLVVLCGASYVDTKPDNLIQTLSEMGFDGQNAVSSYITPTPEENDTAGFVIAGKKLEDSDVVITVIKGTSENAEWYSNFNLGRESDEHLGFLTAAGTIMEELVEFTDEYTRPVKYIITGHSRGAAVANLLAAQITSQKRAEDDVFAYTFASPAVSVNAVQKGYENIFNITSPVDFVSRFPVSKWGYSRFGTDIFIPAKNTHDIEVFTKIKQSASELYEKKTGKKYSPYEGTYTVDMLSRSIFSKVTGRDEYYTKHLFKSPIEKCTLYEYFSALAGTMSGNAELQENLEILQDYKMDFAVINDFFLENHLYNDRLTSAHSVCAYHSWLISCSEEDLINVPEFYRLKIRTSADITAYDKNGDILCNILQDSVKTNHLAVNTDGSTKYIDIPASMDITVMLTSEEPASADITIEKLRIPDTDIPIKVKDYRNLNIPLQGGIQISFPASGISDNDGTIPADMILTDPVPVITVTATEKGNGVCYGGGTFRKGDSVTLYARASALENFNGWYCCGELLSTQTAYTFFADEDTEIYAVFTEKNNIKGDVNADKCVNSDDLSIMLSSYLTKEKKCDIDKDGTVTVKDLSVLLDNFGKSIKK